MGHLKVPFEKNWSGQQMAGGGIWSSLGVMSSVLLSWAQMVADCHIVCLKLFSFKIKIKTYCFKRELAVDQREYEFKLL